jgi:hypothetical protein
LQAQLKAVQAVTQIKFFFKIELTKPSQKKHWIKKYTKQKGRGIN